MQLSDEQRKQLSEKLKNMSPEELAAFQKQQCVFCKIIEGSIPSKKVFEDDKCIAILDINPANPGHILLLPKEHYTIMPQIPEKITGHLFNVAKELSQVQLKSLGAKGTNIFVANGAAAGQKAQHIMIHIIPRKESDNIGLTISEKQTSNEELLLTMHALAPGLKQHLSMELNLPKIPEELKQKAAQKQAQKKQEAQQEQKKDPETKTNLDNIANLLGGGK